MIFGRQHSCLSAGLAPAGLPTLVGVPRQSAYYHDPNAPVANSLAPTSFAVVRDARGRVLLLERIDTRNWELPGGKVNVGESALDAWCVRWRRKPAFSSP
ncbi:NUDIX hydrolase [Saccharopolyspora hattusasensis]|uniref:NUDIX hydrolase n=1 Tax=Saccharopolyspora hattusasensis TaxID=1128679 RepID=UPI003D951373